MRYSDDNLPAVGDTVWALVHDLNLLFSGRVTRVLIADSRIHARVEIAVPQSNGVGIWLIYASQCYSQRPQPVVKTDGPNKYTVWED